MRLNFNTIALLVLCLSVVVIVGLFQQPLQAMLNPATSTPTIQNLLPYNLSHIATQLIVQQGETFTQVDKIDGQWQIIGGTNLDDTRETNHDFVVGVLSLMSTFEYSRVFETEDLAQYGLSAPTASIEIRISDEAFTLKLGQTNPDGDSLYMQVDDTQTVYLVPAVFEFTNIMRLAILPPYLDVNPAQNDNLPGNLLFPDVFGYQIEEFMIRDRRDGSFITYRQGELGTWIIDGTVVNTEIEVDHVQSAVNVSQFLFLEIEPLEASVMESVIDLAILTLSMTIDDGQSYVMNVYSLEDIGYIGQLKEDANTSEYALPVDIINMFFDMVREPPYVNMRP